MTRSARRLLLCTALGAATTANAALVNGSVLTIEVGSFFTIGSVVDDSPPGGSVTGAFLTGFNGLILGTVQEASGSHTGIPDGSESPNIDRAWDFLGLATGMHESKSPTNVLSASGNTATADFSGWGVDFGGEEDPLGTGAWLPGTTDGIASVTCSVDCGIGDTYVLTYLATGDCGGCFDPPEYYLELHGTISSVVPVPPAIWLFGSGLTLLAGLRRYRRSN